MAEFFVNSMAILSFAASFGYFASGDIPRGIYWCCAGALTTATLYIK